MQQKVTAHHGGGLVTDGYMMPAECGKRVRRGSSRFVGLINCPDSFGCERSLRSDRQEEGLKLRSRERLRAGAKPSKEQEARG